MPSVFVMCGASRYLSWTWVSTTAKTMPRTFWVRFTDETRLSLQRFPYCCTCCTVILEPKRLKQSCGRWIFENPRSKNLAIRMEWGNAAACHHCRVRKSVRLLSWARHLAAITQPCPKTPHSDVRRLKRTLFVIPKMYRHYNRSK